MKTALSPILLFLALTSSSLFAENVAPNESPSAAPRQEQAPTPESVLASQVSEIASTSGLSHREKEKRISNAVRLAITTAVADAKDPSQLVAIATSLATAAAKGAPEYAQAIVPIVEDLPGLAQIDGAVAQIRAAILAAAADTDESRGVAHFASPPYRPPSNPEFGGSTTDVIVSRSH